MIIIALTIAIATSLFTIYGYPLLYKGLDDFLVDSWFKFDNLTTKGKQKIRNHSLSTIKMIYEINNKPSKKKILLIAIILNSLYAVVMYTNIPLSSFVTTQMSIIGLVFFIIGGTIVMTTFEYFAYKINMNAIKKYIKTNDIKIIRNAIINILFKMYFLPLALALLCVSVDDKLGFLSVYILYFSPLGIIGFIFDMFGNNIGNSKYLLLLSSISLFVPILFFITMEFYYSLIKKIIVPTFLFLEKISKCLHKDINKVQCSKNMKVLIWLILFFVTIINIIAVLSLFP